MEAKDLAAAAAVAAGGICVEPRIKVISMGSSGVGKSCIIKRYCEGRFVTKYIPTIGIDYGVKRVVVRAPPHMLPATPKLAVRVNFWDMAGGEEYLEIRNEFYNAAEGALLVYDVTDAASFAALDKWVKEMETNASVRRGSGNEAVTASVARAAPKAMVVVVCANKADDEVYAGASTSNNNNSSSGVGGKKRVVSDAEGRRWAEGRGYKYFETSACKGTCVAEALESLFSDVVARFM
ncbi:ras-related GTP-binding protein [Trypanosoma grayi]|uniref:ras-related GTP-binding protein n=1 Tax=Trypanosoma grayi TaxID=71804 RepID=UPI0004F47B9C|nr:ras-related GTP-binding protein [Trypanosoma grayi]KEG07123.1 ras-related GTP-binding protein [Trypanosoma grayi]